MDQDVLSRLQSFKLRDEEASGFQLDSSDIQLNKKECLRSLIGKIHGDKVANFTGLKKTLCTIWTSIGVFKIREMGANLYQFVFSSQQDKMRILNGKAWIFDGQFLILKPWSEDKTF